MQSIFINIFREVETGNYFIDGIKHKSKADALKGVDKVYKTARVEVILLSTIEVFV